MRSIAEVRRDVMLAVFADRDRSIERAVDLALVAGIAHERERVRAILELKGPPARGIEQAMLIMALAGCSLEAAVSYADILSDIHNSSDLARLRRSEFRLVESADGATKEEPACG